MRFPRERLGFAAVFEGRTDPDGFITLDLKALDMEGVTKLVISWSDLQAARAKAAEGESAAKRIRDLLSD